MEMEQTEQIIQRYPVRTEENKSRGAWRFRFRWSINKAHPLRRKTRKDRRSGEETSSFCYSTKADALSAAVNAQNVMESNLQGRYQNGQDCKAEVPCFSLSRYSDSG